MILYRMWFCIVKAAFVWAPFRFKYLPSKCESGNCRFLFLWGSCCVGAHPQYSVLNFCMSICFLAHIVLTVSYCFWTQAKTECPLKEGRTEEEPSQLFACEHLTVIWGCSHACLNSFEYTQLQHKTADRILPYLTYC